MSKRKKSRVTMSFVVKFKVMTLLLLFLTRINTMVFQNRNTRNINHQKVLISNKDKIDETQLSIM